MNFSTKEINIETIVLENLEFLIPVYQRPYVWDDIEIKKLLEDLKHNFENNRVEDYFVGNTYVIKSAKEYRPNLYEVIDGQQRFTTFWLMSLCFRTLKIDTEFTNYLEIEFDKHKDIRFDFDIRKEVYEYLKGLLDGTAERRFHDINNDFLKNIAKGIETIKSILSSEIPKEKLSDFGNYIYRNVKFILNEAPENTDLNALFVALGTSGIQLQQSDILKARLLGELRKENENTSIIQYAKIWEACENMNNYFESNVKDSFDYDTSKVVESDFKEFNEEKFDLSNALGEIRNNKMTISQIIKEDINSINNEEVTYRNAQCRSIINFNMFLLHVLRIYKKQNGQQDISSLDSKKLLETFKIEDIKDIRSFFKLMWKVRYQFDKYVVKWLKDEDESHDEDEKLLLSEITPKISKEGKTYFSRTEKSYSNLQMLQSVLYFNNIPNQIWLTPFLDFLLIKSSENGLNDNIILNELERIDNILLPGDKKEMSWQILVRTAELPKFDLIKKTLNEASGTSFNHYWFYKLEYLLWKNWDKRDDDRFKRYRITSKNSIEHVFPQNQEYKIKLSDLNDNVDWLNSFGNLALLSVGQNSSYSNQDVDKKRIDFRSKDTFDSLKLDKIYFIENWNSEQIQEHQSKMIEIFENHYSN